MLIKLYNSDKSKCLNVSKELFFDTLKSRAEFEAIHEVLMAQFELEQLLKLNIVEVKIQEKSDYEKLCNLIRKRIN